jgi:hypothetical protein
MIGGVGVRDGMGCRCVRNARDARGAWRGEVQRLSVDIVTNRRSWCIFQTASSLHLDLEGTAGATHLHLLIHGLGLSNTILSIMIDLCVDRPTLAAPPPLRVVGSHEASHTILYSYE